MNAAERRFREQDRGGKRHREVRGRTEGSCGRAAANKGRSRGVVRERWYGVEVTNEAMEILNRLCSGKERLAV